MEVPDLSNWECQSHEVHDDSNTRVRKGEVVIAHTVSFVLAIPLRPCEADWRANEYRGDGARQGFREVDYDACPYYGTKLFQWEDLEVEDEE